MSNRNIYSFRVLYVVLLMTLILSCSSEKNKEFSEIVKISLRDVGHQLLLSNQDSTSLVLPIVALEKTRYKLSFQNQLSIDPDSLVSIVKSSFQKSELSKYYRVEVFQCSDQEVAYSYEVKDTEERGVIPCSGRILDEGCYSIEVKFTKMTTSFFGRHIPLMVLFTGVLGFLGFIILKRKQTVLREEHIENHASIGSFRFYPEQNKLVKEAIEISLSKKECELLEIFVARPNQIIKRDELEKRVWEDQGVIVGRSLDTYISKLRKKLKDDDTIKLTNVHGIGYKLEIDL